MKKIIYLMMFVLLQAMVFAEDKVPQWVLDGDVVTDKSITIVSKSTSKQEALLIAVGKLTSTYESKILEKTTDNKIERSISATGIYGKLEVVEKTNETYYKKPYKKEIYKAGYMKYTADGKVFKLSNYIADVPVDYKHEFQMSEDKITFEETVEYMKSIGFILKFYYTEDGHFVSIEMTKEKLEKSKNRQKE